MWRPADDSWLCKWYPPIGNYDGVPLWEQVTAPGIACVRRTRRKHTGSRQYTIVTLPRAAHNLTVRPEPGEPFDSWRIAPGSLIWLSTGYWKK
jgi:hypothetical protein